MYIYGSNKIDCETIYEIKNFLTSNIRVDLETELFKDTLLEDSNLSDYIKNQASNDMERLKNSLNLFNFNKNS